MREIIFHGRGGQGAVIASKILAKALFYEGLYAQAFPTFGAERRGAPVAAFVRAAAEPITVRSRITTPDFVVVMAARLLETAPVTAGLRKNGLLLLNSHHPIAELPLEGVPSGVRTVSLDCNRIALAHGLGSEIMPLINAPILGALARLSGLVSCENLLRALPDFIPVKIEENHAALEAAWEQAEGER